MTSRPEDSSNSDDSAAQTGRGDAGEGSPVEPWSEDVEEAADSTAMQEIPIGTPVHPDTFRRLKRLAETPSDDDESGAQTDENQPAERTEAHGDH
jgi:hypothetical protein